MTEQSSQPVVLVVDDEALLRMHAADVLDQEGYSVLEASSAAEALSLLKRRTDVRLLFTDIQMPGKLDGMDLARQVHNRWPHILLIVTSGQLKPGPAEIPDEGRFIGKPYSSETLVSQVNDLVQQRS